MRYVMALVILAVTGCSDAVRLQHPQTKQVVTCGPYVDTVNAPYRENQCITDFQRQGYERLP